ncbi:MAG: hypothetical protein KGI75_03635 [Rhizobiaceae bacterium]|nr:hypothetical protein [Rhizobiaceae bacterium]
MTIRLEEESIVFVGKCGVEEVETLLTLLEAYPRSPVDLTQAETIHTAIWQALMMAKSDIRGIPSSSKIAPMILSAIGKNASF